MKRSPKVARRFVAATGASFSDEDAEIIGSELEKIAEANRIDNIRSLDDRLVLKAVLADKKHPLRAYYEWDLEKAAKAYWLARTAQIRRGIRVVRVGGVKLHRPMPQTVYCPNYPRGQSANGPARRGHVISEDMLKNDPAFVSACSWKIGRVRVLLEQLEHVTSLRAAPEGVAELIEGWRASLDAYLARIDQAAE